ncbi:MAG: S41 family peptidase [Bacteroidota bacterium]
MNKLKLLLFFFIASGTSNAQDIRVQEPIKNFEKLWKEFNDRYSFFELKNIDWQESYDKYRPLINNSTSNDSLFTVCERMLNELKDGHVSLVQFNKDKTVFRENVPAYEDLFRKNFPISEKEEPNIYQLLNLTDLTLEQYGFGKYINKKTGIIKYKVSSDYGYVTIRAMHGQPKKAFISDIDNALKAFNNKKGAIIDIRLNGGGDGDIAFEIAGRFADKQRIAHFMKERIKGTNEFKKIETTYILPKGKTQFTKPIVLLTSDWTASAAEEFTLAMRELPYVTIVGDNTDGMLSDQYGFSLPNKWKVTLSHQQYYSADMVNYEGVGIPPDFKLLNQPEDLLNGADPLIEKAIELLKEKTNANNGNR